MAAWTSWESFTPCRNWGELWLERGHEGYLRPPGGQHYTGLLCQPRHGLQHHLRLLANHIAALNIIEGFLDQWCLSLNLQQNLELFVGEENRILANHIRIMLHARENTSSSSSSRTLKYSLKFMALKKAEAIKGTVPPVTQYKYLNIT
jgi:hypothetical protein